MKLRRAIAATATVAALAGLGPIALLSATAPVASADATADGTPSAKSTDAPPADAAGPVDPVATPSAPSPTSPATDPGTTPPADPPADAPADPATGPGDATAEIPGPPTGTTAPGQDPSGPTREPDAHHPDGTGPRGTTEGTEGQDDPGAEAEPGIGWSPGQCQDFVPDDGLPVHVSGLPGKIVAGSGWHPFVFSVTNRTGAPLRDIYVQSFTEYTSGVNEGDSLQLDLARLQFKDPATSQWTDAYQDFYQDGTERHSYSGTFVALVPRLGEDARVDLPLRVDIAAGAPPGAAFALSTAVYSGHGGTCNLNGDTYDFTVLKAGSHLAGAGDAEPTGEKPMPRPHDGSHAQGGVFARPLGGSLATGSLASTGTSEAVPIMGLIGAFAVLTGAAMLYLARRRAAAQAYGAAYADDTEPTEDAAATENADGTLTPNDTEGTDATDATEATDDAEGTEGTDVAPDDGETPGTTTQGGTTDTTGTTDTSESRGTTDATDASDSRGTTSSRQNSESSQNSQNSQNSESSQSSENSENGKDTGASGTPGSPDHT